VVVSEGRADDEQAREEEAEERSRTRRIVAAALLIIAAVVAFLILTGGSKYEVTAEFANASQLPQLSMFRAYTPELVGWFDDFGPGSGFNDALGSGARIEVTLNAFTLALNGLPNLLAPPLSATEFAAAVTNGSIGRCPGGNERPVGDVEPGDNSVPFTDGGALIDGIPGDCDPSKTLPGP
jgi:hypothetical protein